MRLNNIFRTLFVFAIAWVLLAPLPSRAAVAIVNQQICTASGATPVACVLTAPTSGNLLVFLQISNNVTMGSSGAISGVGAGCGGVFSTALAGALTFGSMSTRINTTPAGSGLCTVSWSGTGGGDRLIWAVELSGSDISTAPADGTPKAAGANSGGNPYSFTDTYATSTNGSILLVYWGGSDTFLNCQWSPNTPATGFTQTARDDTVIVSRGEYLLVTTAATTTDGWTSIAKPGCGGRDNVLVQIGIKPAGAGGGRLNFSVIRVGNGD